MTSVDESAARKSAAGEGANTEKPTPGPWLTFPASTAVWHLGGGAIAQCFWVSGSVSVEEAVANARLIAAAPELLAALKRALPILMVADDNLPSLNERIAQAEAAFRLAEGL